MTQTTTGKLTEQRVIKKLENNGLIAYKPVPDRGVDIIAYLPGNKERTVKIQVKGRNPKRDPNLRWFQVRVPAGQMKKAKELGIAPDQTWKDKINKVDFFVLDAMKLNEMWVFSREEIYKVIELNHFQYGGRPDNIFSYNEPIKQCQKEMNLDVIVDHKPLTQIFKDNLNNFKPIIDYISQ